MFSGSRLLTQGAKYGSGWGAIAASTRNLQWQADQLE
jgi:hypothetical protein